MILSSPAFAACDVYGNCDDEESGSLFQKEEQADERGEFPPQPENIISKSEKRTIGGALDLSEDRLGQVTGSIGDRSINLSPDRLGGLSGTIGGENANLYKDRLGGIKGRIGDDNVNLYESRTGTISGQIGDQRVTCYENRIGQTNCH